LHCNTQRHRLARCRFQQLDALQRPPPAVELLRIQTHSRLRARRSSGRGSKGCSVVGGAQLTTQALLCLHRQCLQRLLRLQLLGRGQQQRLPVQE
jgi:hypothetical protein